MVHYLRLEKILLHCLLRLSDRPEMVIVSEVGKQLVVEELRRDEGAWMLWIEDIWSHSRP